MKNTGVINKIRWLCFDDHVQGGSKLSAACVTFVVTCINSQLPVNAEPTHKLQ